MNEEMAMCRIGLNLDFGRNWEGGHDDGGGKDSRLKNLNKGKNQKKTISRPKKSLLNKKKRGVEKIRCVGGGTEIAQRVGPLGGRGTKREWPAANIKKILSSQQTSQRQPSSETTDG